MAKPINLYQGPAPAAMAQMGQGILETGARIGQTLQRGYESMGQGIASGINAVSDAYKQSKEDEAKFNATKKMFKAFGGSLDEGARKEIDTIFADTSMSVREKNALAPTLMQFLGASNQQQQALAKQQKELDARAALQAANEAAQNWRTLQQIDSAENEPFRRQAASMMTSGFGGTSKSSGYGGGKAPGNVSLYGDTPFTFGSHF